MKVYPVGNFSGYSGEIGEMFPIGYCSPLQAKMINQTLKFARAASSRKRRIAYEFRGQ